MPLTEVGEVHTYLHSSGFSVAIKPFPSPSREATEGPWLEPGFWTSLDLLLVSAQGLVTQPFTHN